MFTLAKEKRPNVLQMYSWNVSSFYEGIRESKDAIHPANTLFCIQWNMGGDSADKKRFRRSTWNESDLWVPGSQARKWGQLLVYRGHVATEEGAKQLSVLFRKARATQTWLACQVQLLSPSSPEIIIVCFPFFFFSLCPFKHTAIFTHHLLAHGSSTVGLDLQPVFQASLLARRGKGTSVFEHPLCSVLIWLQEMFGNVRPWKEAGSSTIYTN